MEAIEKNVIPAIKQTEEYGREMPDGFPEDMGWSEYRKQSKREKSYMAAVLGGTSTPQGSPTRDRRAKRQRTQKPKPGFIGKDIVVTQPQAATTHNPSGKRKSNGEVSPMRSPSVVSGISGSRAQTLARSEALSMMSQMTDLTTKMDKTVARLNKTDNTLMTVSKKVDTTSNTVGKLQEMMDKMDHRQNNQDQLQAKTALLLDSLAKKLKITDEDDVSTDITMEQSTMDTNQRNQDGTMGAAPRPVAPINNRQKSPRSSSMEWHVAGGKRTGEHLANRAELDDQTMVAHYDTTLAAMQVEEVSVLTGGTPSTRAPTPATIMEQDEHEDPDGSDSDSDIDLATFARPRIESPQRTSPRRSPTKPVGERDPLTPRTREKVERAKAKEPDKAEMIERIAIQKRSAYRSKLSESLSSLADAVLQSKAEIAQKAAERQAQESQTPTTSSMENAEGTSGSADAQGQCCSMP